jgi:hypothetical protein
MQRYGEVHVYLQAFLTSVLDGDKWLTSRLTALPPRKNPGTRWIGEASLDVVTKRKILPCRESDPGRPARSLVTDSDIPAPVIGIHIKLNSLTSWNSLP